MSSKYRIEHTRLSHFYEINPRERDEEAVFADRDKDMVENQLKYYAQSSYSFTGFYEDDIIGIAGLFPLGNGNAEAWMFTSPLLSQHAKFVVRQIKEHLLICEDILKLNRIQAVCLESFEPAQRFLQRLGFVCETPNGMKNYGKDKETFFLYARTKDD